MKTSVNIGLNVGTNEPKRQLSKTLIELSKIYNLDSIRLDNDGLYTEQKERVLIAYFEPSNKKDIGIWLSMLSNTLEQDCIAYKVDGIGYMAFNPDYKGEKFPFNQEYYHD